MNQEKKVHEIYDGEVILTFDPQSPRRRYTVTDKVANREDEPMRGVTTLLRDVIHKPDLLMWPLNMAVGVLEPKVGSELTQEMIEEAKRAHRAKSDKGKDIGSLAHAMIENFLRGGDDVINTVLGDHEIVASLEEAKMAIKSYETFLEWWQSLPNIEIVGIEEAVYSRSLAFAGTYDLLIRIDGKLYMIDIKTTNRSRVAPKGIYAEYFLQLGAYSQAHTEGGGEQPEGLAVVNVGKDGKLGIASNDDIGVSVEFCEQAFAFAARVHDWLDPVQKRLKDNAKEVSNINPLGNKVETPDASN